MEVIVPGKQPNGESTFRCRVCGLEAKRGFLGGEYDRSVSGTPWKCEKGCKLSKEDYKKLKEEAKSKGHVEEPTGPIPVPLLDVSYLPVSDLKVHPLNADIYGNEDKDFNAFLKSVRAKGINSPLIITKDNVIISGHRRYLAAKQLSISEVPVTVFSSDDNLDIEEQLLDLNKYRELTLIQKTRTFLHYKKIEEEKAKRRMGYEALSGPVIFPDLKGDSRDIAAAKVGFSGKTMENAVKVLDKIEALKNEGKTEEAEKIEKIFNVKGSVNGALKAIKKIEKVPGNEDKSKTSKKKERTDSTTDIRTDEEGSEYEVIHLDESTGTYVQVYRNLTEEGKGKIIIFSDISLDVDIFDLESKKEEAYSAFS